MDANIKGYCLLWEKHLQEEDNVFNFNYLNGIKICDYNTLRKIKKGEVVSSQIYNDLFLSLNVKYHEDEKLNQWLFKRLEDLKESYEYFDSNRQQEIYKDLLQKIDQKEYPYKAYRKALELTRIILNDFQTVSILEQTLLCNLLEVESQAFKTILSLALVWNKTRLIEDEKIIYNYAMSLPFIDDYLGLYTKARMSLFLQKHDDFLKYIEASEAFVREDNVFAKMKYYAFMEGYHDTKKEIELARFYLDQYRDTNLENKDKMGNDFYASNCYYLWISYYMIDEYDIAYEYMIEYFSCIKEARFLEKIIYFSLCSLKGIQPTLFNPCDIDEKNCKGIDKRRIHYFQMLYNNQPISRRKAYLITRYKPVVSKAYALDLKIIENELNLIAKK